MIDIYRNEGIEMITLKITVADWLQILKNTKNKKSGDYAKITHDFYKKFKIEFVG